MGTGVRCFAELEKLMTGLQTFRVSESDAGRDHQDFSGICMRIPGG